MKESIYRKALKEELFLEDNQVSPLISKAKIFEGLSSQQGYATAYDYDQAFLMYTGCELLRLGISFRRVNALLIEMRNLMQASKVDEFYKLVKNEQGILIVFPQRKKIDDIQVKRLGFSGLTKNVAGKYAAKNSSEQKMIAPSILIIGSENAILTTMLNEPYNMSFNSFINVKLYNLINLLDEVFS